VKPKALDLFCGAGGATKGLQQAGFYVVGVDIKSQSNYCGDEFVQADATKCLDSFLDQFDFIWASPPCQRYLCKAQGWNYEHHPDLIEPVRQMLLATGKPFVIENNPKAPIRKDLMLCGTMFNLKVLRHRCFEVEGFKCDQIPHQKHQGSVYTGEYCAVYNGGDGVGGYGTNNEKRRAARKKMKELGVKQTFERWKEAMDIYWMNKQELTQAIPPAYSKYIGEQFLAQKGASHEKEA
jgi:hypothetical protein